MKFIATIILTVISAILSTAKADDVIYTAQGVVTDSISHEPVPFAAIKIPGTPVGKLADENGKFKITSANPIVLIEVSSMGYTTKVAVPKRGGKNMKVQLVPTGVQLSEVIVKPKKEKYSKKNNPAVDFVRKIRKSSDMGNPRKVHNDYNYNKYERITIALNNISPDDNKNLILKKFDFLRQSIDTSEVSGHPILALSTREKASTINYSNGTEKETVTGVRQEGLDDFLDESNMRTLYDDIFPEIDLYQNDIELLRNRFVSPLSRIAPDFYKFYLTDTVEVDSQKCIVLSFVPHNSQSFGFTGKVYVPMGDSTMFIRKVEMNVPIDNSLNFIDRLYINQEFEQAPDGSRLLIKDDIIAEVNVLPMMQGLYFRRNSAYSGHNFDQLPNREIFDNMSRQIMLPEAETRTEDFWTDNRQIPYKEKERNVGKLAEELRKSKFYYWSEKFIKVMVIGYIGTKKEGSKFDFGPISNTISSNYLEGLRLRVGGVTTAHFSPNWFLSGYTAYGFKDHKWKYQASVEYSFNDKKEHANEFPVHSIKLSHKYDVNMLGQKFTTTNPDNVVLSLKRHTDRQITYNRETKLGYTLELRNNFSVKAALKHSREEATPSMTFIDGYGRNYSHFNETSFEIQLRYAPGEKFYQTRTERRSINKDNPVITLTHRYAPRGFMGNLYEINNTELRVQKRFWLSAFGNFDMIIKGGHLWSSVSYPDLLIPNANLSYVIQPESFALLNPMEFLTDSYASWDFTYRAHGAVFNYIPLLKKLKLREIVTFKGVIGHLSKKNNPDYNKDLFRVPSINHTQSMTNTPYMEIGVGIDNIFKVLRLDYVWRLTYRHNYEADRRGLRVALHFDF